VESYNLYDGELEERAGVPAGYAGRSRAVGPLLGADQIGLSVYELPPGRRTWPYHYELGREEWVLVLAGAPTLREPGGERVLGSGDVVCFPDGPAGAHQLRNDTAEPARIVLLSEWASTGYGCVYPDSDKALVVGPETRRMLRSSPELDYWDGEE
jgi:uncharacterized cupin superfamily protein